jgi:DNA-binding NarL/FixJ family response regulator
MRVVIVDDHPFVQEALRSLVISFLPAADVIKVHQISQLELLLLNSAAPVNLVLLDLQLADENSLDYLESNPGSLKGIKLVMFTGGDDALVQRALRLGRYEVVSKGASSDQLVRAIRMALGFRELDEPVLTSRQCELMDLLAVGWTNKQISERMHITERTVKAHLSQIFDRLGVQNRSQAVRRYGSLPKAQA